MLLKQILNPFLFAEQTQNFNLIRKLLEKIHLKFHCHRKAWQNVTNVANLTNLTIYEFCGSFALCTEILDVNNLSAFTQLLCVQYSDGKMSKKSKRDFSLFLNVTEFSKCFLSFTEFRFNRNWSKDCSLAKYRQRICL